MTIIYKTNCHITSQDCSDSQEKGGIMGTQQYAKPNESHHSKS